MLRKAIRMLAQEDDDTTSVDAQPVTVTLTGNPRTGWTATLQTSYDPSGFGVQLSQHAPTGYEALELMAANWKRAGFLE